MLNSQSECKQMRGDVRMRRRMYAELGYGGRGVSCKSSPLNDVSILAVAVPPLGMLGMHPPHQLYHEFFSYQT